MRGSRAIAKVLVASLIALLSGFTGVAAATGSQLDSELWVNETYSVGGVQVHKTRHRYQPATKPPVIMVHGGMHGAWAFQHHAPELAQRGHDVHALNWFNHGGSAALPQAEWIARGIANIAHREIRTVALSLPRTPIIIGHSMGALAAMEYAANYPVDRLVLITPVVPASIGATPLPLAVDLTQPFPVFPFPVAKQLFFPTMNDWEAQNYYAQLQPESPRAVWEASRFTVNVNLAAVTEPTLVISAGHDSVTPANDVARLATALGAPLRHYSEFGHSDVLLRPVSYTVALDIASWLS
jgi:pimeloyl-ACP methyl ester carboxylesterase